MCQHTIYILLKLRTLFVGSRLAHGSQTASDVVYLLSYCLLLYFLFKFINSVLCLLHCYTGPAKGKGKSKGTYGSMDVFLSRDISSSERARVNRLFTIW